MKFTSVRSVLPRVAAAAAAAFALATPPIASHAAGDADPALTNVVALAAQRLALAEPVARWKWAHRQAIEDSPRERALLADVDERARHAGVDPAFARAFFQDQIDASKQVQSALFERWRDAPPSDAGPDLATVTRAQLDTITKALIAALARVQPLRTTTDCPIRVARTLADWKAMTTYDASRSAAMRTALSHVCTSGGVGAVG
jgi:chorismate mutase